MFKAVCDGLLLFFIFFLWSSFISDSTQVDVVELDGGLGPPVAPSGYKCRRVMPVNLLSF